MTDQALTDRFGRVHNYLRISLTERCNLRCFYCMPDEGVPLLPKSSYMTADELMQIAETMVGLGVDKIRLTGGEPLLRKDAPEIIERLASLPVDLGLTTNGILLDRFLPQIERLNIKLNLSLDSLNKEKNFEIVKRDYFDRIMSNLKMATDRGIFPSINCVLMSSINDDEIVDFIELTKELPVSIRFIEFMPFNGNHWQFDKCVPDAQVLNLAQANYGESQIIPLQLEDNYIARNYQVKGYKGSFGLISTVTKPFCQACNRIRLTADGKLKNCLFSVDEVDLLSALREAKDIRVFIQQNIWAKKEMRGGIVAMDDQHISMAENNRSMIRIGG